MMENDKVGKRTLADVQYTGDFSVFLHELRSVALATLKTPNRLLSAGCAGLWYFDWIDKYLGKPSLHIGLEFYSPKPEGLPSHVEWIQQNVYAMKDVESASVDMVFSGQNVEHLWADELAGFLSEANRVLEQGGLLVVDSPNFPICQEYGWSHPEHITEFSIPQFKRLLGIYGFSVEQCIGLWGCRIDDTLLPLDPGQGTGSLFARIRGRLKRELVRISPVFSGLSMFNRGLIEKRIRHGLANPEDSFSWWLVAKKKSASAAEKKSLLSSVHGEFAVNWPSRIQRMVVASQLKYDIKTDLVLIKKGFSGVAMYGPYLPLKAGTYLVGYYLVANHSYQNADEAVAYIDCAVGTAGVVIAKKTVTCRELNESPVALVTLEISLAQLTFGVQVRLISNGVVSFLAYRSILLQETS